MLLGARVTLQGIHFGRLSASHAPPLDRVTRDGTKVDSLLYAGNSLGRARAVFESAIKHRPRIRLTIRQQTRVLEQSPRLATPPPAAG